jgi:hypothetical protein
MRSAKRKLLLVASLALLNAVILRAKPRPAQATDTDPNDGVCAFCQRPGGYVDWCCAWDQCGGEGQPKCDCRDATQCG